MEPRTNVDLAIGQHFFSQSKVQAHPVEYIYMGELQNGMHQLKAASGILIEDCTVYPEWFDNRNITRG